MKKKNIILTALAVIALSSCDLTLYPEHETTPEQYYRNESDLLLWSNNFYTDNLSGADIGQNDADDKIDNGLSAYITAMLRLRVGALRRFAISTICWTISTSAKTFR